MVQGVTKDEMRWNGAAIVFFMAAFIVCGAFLASRGSLTALYSFSFIDITVLGLATFRAAHLLTSDKIFEFVREFFMDKRGKDMTKPPRGFRRMVSELLECLWCTGMWSALIMLTLYLSNPTGRFIVWIAAIAGIGSLLQLISKRIAA